MSDDPAAIVAGHRIALAAMRELLDAERARSDARLLALARIAEMARSADDAPCDALAEALANVQAAAQTALEER